MKRSLSNKRVARKIGRNDDEDTSAADGPEPQESAVKRPPLSSKAKKGSKLRMSFGPSSGNDDGDGEEITVVTPKKSLGRQAIERRAERNALRPAISSEQLSFRAGQEDRPSYSKDSLAELKLSTPSTPRDTLSIQASEDEEVSNALDITSKFGTSSARPAISAIPTEAEIKAKKERRARLAQENDFISLDADNSEEERQELLLRPKDKYAETRLVRDDEDLAEGFDDYVEDGKIALGRKAEREQRNQKRREMAELIAEAEGAGDVEEEDDSEAERNEAYEAAQTRAGTYGQQRSEDEYRRPRTPPKITPVPNLNSVLDKMREGLETMQHAKAAKIFKLEELRAERKEIVEREVWIQAQLKEVGERYEKLRVEAGMASEVNGLQKDANQITTQRGLESYGSTPIALSESNSDDG